MTSTSSPGGHGEHNIEFTGCRPIFEVRDLRRSAVFYTEQLGFTKDWEWPGDGEPATFCYVYCSYFELFLREVAEPSPGEIVVGCASRELVDRAYNEYIKRGVEIGESPSDSPWGTYGFQVKDPDGNVLSILR